MAKKLSKAAIARAKAARSERQREAAHKAWITRRATTNPSESAALAWITRRCYAETETESN